MGFDDEFFERMKLKIEPADDLKKVFLEKGFARIRIQSPKRNHNPTDAGHCPRKRVLSFLGAPTTNAPGPAQKMIFDMGNRLGESGVILAQRTGIYLDHEPHITIYEQGLDYPFTGRPDLVIADPYFETILGMFTDAEGNQVPVEFKTIKTDGYDTEEGTYKYGEKAGQKYMKWGVDQRPKKDHIMQLHHYMHPQALAVPYGYIVYLNKNDQRMAFHRVYWSDLVWEEIVNEALIVEEYVRRGIVPTKESVGLTKPLEFYVRNADGKIPGDIKLSTSNFPCWWKGKDGGEPGCCDYLGLCYRDQILKFGNGNEKAKLKVAEGFEFKEGVLDVNLANLKSAIVEDES